MTQTLPPRDELLRMAPFEQRDEGDSGDGLTLDGYAAVFNRETIIDSWEGRFREQLAPGSMRRSFRILTPRVQFDHGSHPLIGSLPIGAVQSIREDTDPELAPEGGAHVVARLHDNWLVEPVRDAIASRSVDGMSFRFTVKRELWQTADGTQIKDYDKLRAALAETQDAPDEELLLRTLREVNVPELGPVVFPAYADTSVGIRSDKITIDLGRITERSQQRQLAETLYAADALERERLLGVQGRKVKLDVGLDNQGFIAGVLREAVRDERDQELPDTQPDDSGHLSDGNTRSQDAQPEGDGHPSGTDDAQPSPGHPSEPPASDLRDEIQQWVQFSKDHLASITSAKET